MKEIGAFEAKNKFGQLLDWVEAGNEVSSRGAARSWRAWCSHRSHQSRGRHRGSGEYSGAAAGRHAWRAENQRPGCRGAAARLVIDASLTLTWYLRTRPPRQPTNCSTPWHRVGRSCRHCGGLKWRTPFSPASGASGSTKPIATRRSPILGNCPSSSTPTPTAISGRRRFGFRIAMG